MSRALNQAAHASLYPLFTELGHNLMIDAVLDGNSRGRVYSDAAANSEAAFVRTTAGYFLAGRTDIEPFKVCLANTVAAIRAGETIWPGEPAFDIEYRPDAWLPVIQSILGTTTIATFDQVYFELERPLIPDWDQRILSGLILRSLDETMFDQRLVADDDPEFEFYDLKTWVGTWTSPARFLEQGIAVGAFDKDRLVGWAITDCVSRQRCELGVYVHPGFRRRGLATLITAAAVETCLDHGMQQIGWHCGSDHVASRRIAEAVGFAFSRQYSRLFIRCGPQAITQTPSG
jgi:RimJ/RimL family protein N-acetyltransferase